MFDGLMAVGLALAGYTMAALVFGVRKVSPAARVAWALALAVLVVLQFFSAMVVIALFGRLPAAVSIGVKAWALVAGIGAAGVVALIGGRWQSGARWIAAGGLGRSMIAAGVAGIATIAAVAWIASGAPGDPVPAQVVASASPDESARSQEIAAVCPCGTGLICVGPRGGRYCTRPDGGKSYSGK